jgi:hypothetical protein
MVAVGAVNRGIVAVESLSTPERMEGLLRGSPLPAPRFRVAPMAEELRHVRGFTDLQTFFPTLSRIYRVSKHNSHQVWFDNKWRIVGVDISGTSGPCKLQVVANSEGGAEDIGTRGAFLKVTHLLDPIRWMKGRYSLPQNTGLPWHTRTWFTAMNKLQNPDNQAYVEAMASYALGRLREEGVSPHFNEFYGAFCARAETYRYNLTDEYQSFRNTRWFWNGQKKGLYSLCVIDQADPTKPVIDDIVNEMLREPSIMGDEESDGSDSEEEILVEGGNTGVEIGSIHSDNMSSISFESEEESDEEDDGSDDEDEDEDSEEEDDEDYRIYSVLRNFPVMLIASEDNRGTMDALMDDDELVGATVGTPAWEERWSAWLFQVIAALSCAQSLLGFTHNDLHTNNIVWTETTEEYLWYRSRAGGLFRVPTFGKLFRLIDFGRSIFSINGKQFISDDFCNGNDAEGQYCFKPLHPRPAPGEVVQPNPSFDLSRLAVSLFEGLFPEAPKEKEGGAILSSEEGMEVRETESPLYNVLWSWMVDDDGENILIEADGEEKFPDFGLYKHIAAKVHTAVPAQQFSKPAFDRFHVAEKEVPVGQKIWHLFA